MSYPLSGSALPRRSVSIWLSETKSYLSGELYIGEKLTVSSYSARYFETHKHEIPRSHEICVKRYQRNEADIRKLDAKYGSLVNMIQGLGQKHQPMLPTKEEGESVEVEQVSNERVENWAKAVSADGVGHEEDEHIVLDDEEDRESRFDRPLKEIRVGESPSRPWGIHIPALYVLPYACLLEKCPRSDLNIVLWCPAIANSPITQGPP